MNFTRIKKLEECVCQLRQQLENGEIGGSGACMQFPYTYSPLDDQTPAAGFFQIDAGTIFINGIDGNAQDRTGTFDSLTTGFFIFVGADGAYYYASISAQAENAGIYELTISLIDGTEPVENTEGCVLFLPASGAPNLDAVLGIGNSAGGQDITDVSTISGEDDGGGGSVASIQLFPASGGGGGDAALASGASVGGSTGVNYAINAATGAGVAGNVAIFLGNGGGGTGDAGGGYAVTLGVGDGAGINGQYKIVNIPTADPAIANAIWSDDGTLVQSGFVAPSAISGIGLITALNSGNYLL